MQNTKSVSPGKKICHQGNTQGAILDATVHSTRNPSRFVTAKAEIVPHSGK